MLKDKPDIISLVFEIVCGGRVVYDDLLYRTGNTKEFSPYQSHQKNSQEENLVAFTKWQNLVLMVRNEVFLYEGEKITYAIDE